MSFPQTPLGITAQVNAGGWVDLPVRGDGLNAISITRGVTSSGGSVADRGSCNLTVDNNDGRFSSRNPRSPLFGLIGRNTPITIGVAYGLPWLDVPNAQSVTATTPDSAALSITGDIDIRVDATCAVWGDGQGTSDGTITLAGKTDGLTGFSWWLVVTDTGCLQLNWTPDNVTLKTATSTAPVGLAPWQRQSVRATLDVNNGASGWTATFYTSATTGVAGAWTQLGASVTGAGTTSIYDSTVSQRVGEITALSYGKLARRIHAAQIRNGIGGTIVANPDFTAQAVGATSFTDSASVVWTVPAGAVTNVYRRANMRVPSWPPQWTTGGKDVTTTLNAAGRLQQLGQGQRPLQSTLRRFIPTQANVAAYWSMEDGVDATQAASGLADGLPMSTAGLTFAQDTSLPGSDPLPRTGTTASWSGPLTGIPAGAVRAEMMLYVPQALTANAIPLLIRTTGTFKAIYVTMTTDGGGLISLDAEDGGVIETHGVASPNANTPMWGSWQRLVVTLAQNGTGIDVTFGFLNDIGDVGWYMTTITIASSTLGSATRISGTYGAEFEGTTIGHVAVYGDSSLDWTGPSRQEVGGQAGETAAARVTRVCDEAGVPVSIAGADDTTLLMGPQPHGKVLDVVQDATTTDEGFLCEALEFDGLRMRTRASLYNQASVLDLDYTASPQPLVIPLGPPTDDDQRLVNDSTVTRTNGSSGRYVQENGALSVQDPPDGVGLYDENVTRNLYTDDQCVQSASWRVHIGTWDEARYPAITIYLEKNPNLIPQVCAIDTGSRIRITGDLPSWLPAGPIDLLVLGYTETLAQFAWHVTFACVPYGPYQVGVVGDAVLGRADTDGTQLAADVTASATALQLTVSAGSAWTTDPAQYPFDLMLGGEAVTAVGVGTVLSPDPLLLGSLALWTGSNATLTEDTATVNTARGATASLKVVPNGTSASGGVNAASLSGPGTVTAAATYTACGWVYVPAGWTDLQVCVDWHDAAGTFLSSGLGTGVTVAAGQWTFLSQTLTAPASASQMRLRARYGSTPASSVISYWWNLQLIPSASVSTTSPQTMTVIRSINGISKSQTAGTPVALATGPIVAL